MSSSQSSIFTASPMGRSRAAPLRLAAVTAYDTQNLVAKAGQGGLVRRLDVEPEERLGVGRAQVEPPARAGDGQPVELVHGDAVAVRERVAHPLCGALLVADLAVDLPRRQVPGVFGEQRRQRPVLRP